MFLINIIILLISGAFLLGSNVTPKKKKLFCLIATVMWILVSGLRSPTVGADTHVYENAFYTTGSYTWDYLFEQFKNIMFYGAEGKDPGYNLFVKAFYTFWPDYQAYLMFVSILFHVPLGLLIYRESESPLLSWMIYSCLFYSFFAITGTRQTVATALVVLIGSEFIKRKKLLPFILIMLVGFTIHKSAIVFLAYYFISRIKITKNMMVIAFTLMPAVYLTRSRIMKFLTGLIGYEDYILRRSSIPYTFMLIFIIVGIGLYVTINIINAKDEQENPKKRVKWIPAVLVSMVILPLNVETAAIMRISYYFNLSIMIVIPKVLEAFNSRDKQILKIFAMAVLIFLFLQNEHEYLFFWQTTY